ncbi:MAG: 2-oxo acid dehydrogenase subunit E2 [Clostridia bacterium]|nr:2-oxo acid dehydrogenase subunit E2 [Clostridia bacterium]
MKLKNTEHFGIQRKIVANMTSESWRSIPHVSYIYEADVTELFSLFREMNSEYNTKITFNTLMLKIITEGLKAAPVMNSHINFNRRLVRGQINTFENINISMPAILPDGKMMTLNLRNFENRNLDDMTSYINDVTKRAQNSNLDEALFSVSLHDTIEGLKKGHLLKTVYRLVGAKTGKHRIKTLSGKAKREYEAIPEAERLTFRDLEQGTVTVSNIGSTYLGQKGAMALLEIIPPQVCAFGVGAVQKKPAVTENNKIEIRQMLPICIAFDHRALDFGEIAPFMKRLGEIFENPEIIFSWRSEKRNFRRITA